MCMLYLYIHVPCSMCTRVLPNLLPRDRILRCQACLHARCGVCRRPMLKCVRVLSSASVNHVMCVLITLATNAKQLRPNS